MFKNVLRDRFRTRVIVTTKSGQSFDGVLWDADDRALVLRNTTAMAAAEKSTDLPLDGELLVLLTDVAFIQRP